MYVKINNNNQIDVFPYSINQLKLDNSNTSFPSSISDEMLASYNVYAVTSIEPPEITLTQYVTRNALPNYNNGRWEISYSVNDMSAEEAENVIRETRHELLQETDYLALSDNTLTTEMATYRQALRDIPSQSGFPFNVTFPTEPE